MLGQEIAQYLSSEGVVTYHATAGGNVFVDDFPSAPDTAVMIRHTGGVQGSVKTAIANPTVQVMTRAPGIHAAHTLAKNIYNALHGYTAGPFVTGGQNVRFVEAMQDEPNCLGRDDAQRMRYTMNFLLLVDNA